MKIRNGFVSNSSSSSFLIYGVHLDDIETLISNLELTDDEKNSLEAEGDWYLSEILDGKDLDGLNYYSAYDGESKYLGRSWSCVGDDETGFEFKNSIQKKIDSLLCKGIECSTISEAWHD